MHILVSKLGTIIPSAESNSRAYIMLSLPVQSLFTFVLYSAESYFTIVSHGTESYTQRCHALQGPTLCVVMHCRDPHSALSCITWTHTLCCHALQGPTLCIVIKQPGVILSVVLYSSASHIKLSFAAQIHYVVIHSTE